MRVVLTGCAVREPERAGLRRRFPAVDLFLRPDEEPELVDRLGLASAQGAGRASRAAGATTVVGRTTVGAADHLPGHAGRGRRGGRRRARVRDQRLAADRLRLRQDLHLLHRPVQPRPGAEPPVRRDRRRGRGRSPPPATARSRCSARTSTRTATTCRPSRGSPTSTPIAGPAAGSTSTAGRTSPR